MKSNVPVVNQIAWISLIPQIVLLGLLICIFDFTDLGDPFLLGAFTFLILVYITRFVIAKYHRQGIMLIKQHKYEAAIPVFEKSTAFFTKNSWMDKYRFITLLSSSKMTYKEMGLCNIAFCYSQINNGKKAMEYYEKALKENPCNGLAIAGLNMLNSAASE